MKALRVLALMSLAPLAQAAELKDMRLWEGPDTTRVVLDLSGNTKHKFFTLSNPQRLVVDIPGVDGKNGMKIASRENGIGVVRRVRGGIREDGSLRVVFELAAPIEPKTFLLEPNEEYGYRLMLDLQTALAPGGASQPAPAAPALAPQQTMAATPVPAQPVVVEAAPAPVVAAAPVPAPAVVHAAPAPVVAAPVSAPVVVAAAPAVPVTPPAPMSVVVPAPAPAVRLADKPIVIAIDAGHGGEDPGARGKGGTLEKNVALAMARKLARLINETPGMKAVLTRDGDYYVGLRERIGTARKADADLFVSVHANAFKKRDMRGTAVYVLSPRGQTNEHARWLAHKENSADLVGGIELQSKDNELAAVLIDLSQSATMEASFDVGSRILGSMKKVNVLQKPVVQQAGFVVLKAPDIPSVLVETAFITNDDEERMLRSGEHQDKMAQSIYDGIKGYFQSYRPQQTQQVAERDNSMQKVSYKEGKEKGKKSTN